MKENEPLLNRTAVDLEAHEELLQAIRKIDSHTVADGAVVPSRYVLARPRILWVLRETNGGGDWDLREFLRSDTNLFSYPRWHCTFGALAKVSYGILNSLPIEDVEHLSARSAVDALREVAVVNVNKRGGGGRVDWAAFPDHAKDFSTLVESQIAALDPEILIAAGTVDFLPESLYASSKDLRGNTVGAVRLSSSRWLVKCYHTAQTRIPQHQMYAQIVDALRVAGWRMPGRE